MKPRKLTYLNLLQQGSSLLLPFLVFLGVVNGIWTSGLLLVINSKITGKALAFLKGLDWLLFLSVTLLSFITSFLFQTYMIRLSSRFSRSMVVNLFNSLRFTDYQSYERLGEERVRTALDDITALEGFPGIFLEGFNALTLVCFGMGYLFFVNTAGALVMMAVIMILGYIFLKINTGVQRDLKNARKLGESYMTNVNDLLQGFREIKMSTGRSDVLFNEHIVNNRDGYAALRSRAYGKDLVSRLTGTYSFYIGFGAILFLLPVIFKEPLPVQTNFLVTLLFMMGPIIALLNLSATFMRFNVAIDRLNKFNAMAASETGGPACQQQTPVKLQPFDSLVFDGVVYEYTDALGKATFTMEPLHVTINRGDIIFISGGNGSGKSTFIKLLTGLYCPGSGSILFNGQTIRRADYPHYRDNLSCVFADTYLFRVNYDKFWLTDANPELVAWLKLMKLENVVRFDKAGNMIVHSLSKGQSKRMALIYALLEKKDILILDEWAAEQDPEFRKYFYRDIIPYLARIGKTVIAITHDDAYFDRAGRSIRFDYGKIVSDVKIADSEMPVIP